MELEKLLHSDNYKDRRIAAKQGYRLDILICDDDEGVRYEARNYLSEHNMSIFDWSNDNNVDLDIDEWLQSNNWRKRREVAKYGYGLDILVHDEDYHVREVVARQGYGLNFLINDENDYVSYAAQHALKTHKYKSILTWVKNNSSDFSKQLDLSEIISKFIDDIENSSMLALQTNLDSIDDFFNNDSAQIDIVTVDTKIPIITIIKLKEEEYKFELNVTDNAMSSKFTSTDKLLKLMDLVISELNENSEFYKYADELNNCL